MRIRYGSQSDRGRIRSSNEDSFIADIANRLFLVADGMGGHNAGEVASKIAAETMQEVVALQRGSESLDLILRIAVDEANFRIYAAQSREAELSGMGTTLTVLCFDDQTYWLAHVGDSRAYRLRNDVLDQLSRDHSLVWPLYENGMLRKEDISSHPQKNLITRSVGPHAQVEMDLTVGEALEGDVFLLCSDGLTDVLSDSKIQAILSDAHKTPQQLGRILVNAANRGGGPDNITVVVVRLEADQAEEAEQ